MTTAVLTSERSDMDLLIRPNISDIEEEAGAISLNNLSSPPSFNERHDAESSKDGERDDRGEGYKDDSEIKRSVKILVTGLQGAGKRTWVRNLFLNNVEDKAAACARYTDHIRRHIVTSYCKILQIMDSQKIRPNQKESAAVNPTSTWTPEIGRLLQKMSRLYLKEMRSLGTVEHVAQQYVIVHSKQQSLTINSHFEMIGRMSQPDYIPTILDCLIADADLPMESDELTINFEGLEYNFFVVEADDLGALDSKHFNDNLSLIVDVVDASSLDKKEYVEMALNFYTSLNRYSVFVHPDNKIMTVPIVMLFNKFDIFEGNFETKKLDLRNGFEDFKGRKNIETAKEYIKSEFYSLTHGERDVFSCFKSSLSTTNDSMVSISKAISNIHKKREMSKILHLSTKMPIHQVLSGEAHHLVHLGNPDSPSKIPFDKIPWRDLHSLARALQFPATLSAKELNLRNNSLGPRGAKILSDALVMSKTLTSLKLSANSIRDEGVRHIAEMLEKNTNVLLTLNLSGNELTSESAQLLAVALFKNKSLTVLDLSENEIDDDGVRALVNAVQANCRLQVLCLWNNRLRDLGMLDQVYLTNHTLTDLNVSYNLPDGRHPLPHVLSVLKQNYAAGLTSLSLDATDSFRVLDEGADEHFPAPEELYELKLILKTNHDRSKRNGSTILDMADVSRHTLNESVLDFGNYGIEVFDCPSLVLKSDNITELYLDNNALKEIPPEIPALLRCLRILVLHHNDITAITPEIHRLSSLTRLDISNNNLNQALPTSLGFLEELVILDLRFNSLFAICDEVSQLKNLEWLLIQQNNLTTLPSGLFSLTKLQRLDVHGNSIPPIKALIYDAWVHEATEMDLSSLNLNSIPIEIGYLTPLTHLNLADNMLVSLPPVIGNLSNLKTLDLRNNILDSLTWQIGDLNMLEELKLEGNPLSQLPPEVRTKELSGLKSYLRSLASGEEECYRMKIMLVGAENVGKTSISRCLKEEIDSKKKTAPSAPSTLSTDGVDIGNWEYEEDGYPTISFSIWDFAGQEVYYSTHQFFLSTRSVYLIVFNMMVGEEVSRVEYWLQSVKLAARDAAILIVGTHADHPRCTPEYIDALSTGLQQKYAWRFKTIKGFFAVSCKSRKGMDVLKGHIVNIARTQPSGTHRFPHSYIQLEKLMLSERKLRTPPVISFQQFVNMAVSCGVKQDSGRDIALFLNDLGTIVWVDDPKLSKLVILDPSWLAKLMATLFTSKMNFINNGLLEQKNLTFLWKPPDFPESLHATLIDLLEKFEVLYKMPPEDGYAGEKYLLMSLVQDKRPPFEWPRYGSYEERPQAMRIYQLPFVPLGLVAKLMTRLLSFLTPIYYWREGMVSELDACEILLEYQPAKNQIKLHLYGGEPASVVRLLMESFDNLIEGYYKIKREVFICCVHCLMQRTATPHMFALQEVETAAATSKSFLYCEADNQKVAVNITTIAPDLVMADLEHFKMEYSDIQILKPLGEGAFGTVYKAIYKGEEIAFKQLNLSAGADPAELYAELRREVWLSSGLHHPNIVALKGMCLSPCGMAMEFCPQGNLYSWLRSEGAKNTFDWDLRLRIAMDLASGMRFLHNATPKIIHRDFKSPNVLMVLSDTVACKVSDFGASRAVALCSGREDLGNPCWLAPEVMKGESYTEKADVFSYGMVCWEILTGEHPYAEYPISTDKFVSKFEEAIVGLTSTEIINICWEHDPSRRPTFDHIYLALCTLRRKLNPAFEETEEERAAREQIVRAKVQAAATVAAKIKSPGPMPLKTEGAQASRRSIGLEALVSAASSKSLAVATATGASGSSRPKKETTQSLSSATGSVLTRTLRGTAKKELDAGAGGPVATPVIRLEQSYIPPAGDGINCLANVGTETWAGCQDGTVCVYNVENYQILEDRDSHEEAITCMLYDGKGSVWIGSADSKISVWDAKANQFPFFGQHVENKPIMKTGKRRKVLTNHKHMVTCMECTKKYVWSGSLDQHVRVWEIKTLNCVKKIPIEGGPVTSLVIQDEDVWVGAGRQVVLVGSQTLKVVTSLEGHKEKINCMVLANQQQVWSCSHDNTILVWSTDTHEVIDELEYPQEILCLLSGRNGACVYAGTRNKSVLVWNTKNLKMVREQTRHDGAVTALAHGAENYIWSGSEDKTVCIWQEIVDESSLLHNT